MAINLYNIKKWWKMILGKSILHVNQDLGKCFSVTEIKGYYNNLTEKVTLDKEHYCTVNVFPHKSETKYDGVRDVFFPISIFQYGLASYDLFLMNKDQYMLSKFSTHVQWAYEHQNIDGSWDNFGFIYPDAKYSAMAQGEGASLLLRGFIQLGEKKYFEAAKKAIDYMITDVNEGGTTSYNGKEVIMLEYTHLPAVMNGWIFAIFGLYDLTLVCDDKIYKETLEKTLDTLKEKLKEFNCGYWSLYDLEGKIASPFYHNLHIAQMEALYLITGDIIFDEYACKWRKQQKNIFKRNYAFLKKVIQKIIEK